MSTELPPQLADLLKHRAFLERFAQRLARDASVAEDVVQETWLTAIERPPRHRANLRAWLRRVARNAFLQRERSRMATPAFETLSAEPAETPRAPEEGESIARVLAAELLALPEPYRGVLILRFYEDRTPSEIARELGRPVNTVTSQIGRGLKLMHERLDRSRPGGRSEWVRALVALAPGTAPSGPREAIARATRTRNVRTWLVAGAVVVVATVLVLRGRSSQVASDSPLVASRGERPAAPALDRATPDSNLAPDPSLAAPAGARVEVVAADPPAVTPEPDPLATVRVEVVDADGHPIPEAVVQTARSVSPPGSSEAMTAFDGTDLTDASGRVEIQLTDEQRARFGMDDADELGVIVHAAGFAASDVHVVPFPEGGVAALTIPLQRSSAVVHGAVTDANGTPIEGAWVEVGRGRRLRTELGDGRYLLKARITRRTRADGRFEHFGLQPGPLEVWIECPGFVPHVGSFEAPDSSTSVYDAVLHRGGAVAGRAETAEGLAAEGALVRVEFMPKGPNLVVQRAVADADGRFVLEGIVPGTVSLVAEHAGLFAATHMTLAEGDRFTWNPVLSEMPPLRLRVEREDGSPFAGSVVVVESTRQGDAWQRFLTSGADGRVRFDAVPDGELVAGVFPSPLDVDRNTPPCHVQTGLQGGPDESVLTVPRERLGRGSLSGLLLDHEGRPFPQAVLYLRTRGSRFFYPTPVAPGTGAFRTDRLTTQSYELVASCTGLGTVPLDELEIFAGDDFDLGEIRLPRPLVWSPPWPDPEVPEADSYELVKVDRLENSQKLWMVASGAAPPASFALFPGHYEWRVYGAGKRVRSQGFDLR